MLFYSAKRRTSAEVGADKFCDTEFQDSKSGGLDRRISVYRIDAARVVACQAEHYGGVGLGLPGHPAFDLDGLAEDVRSRPRANDWPFEMTRQAHCEACFETDEAVRAMATRLLADLPQRRHAVSSETSAGI